MPPPCPDVLGAVELGPAAVCVPRLLTPYEIAAMMTMIAMITAATAPALQSLPRGSLGRPGPAIRGSVYGS
jgi:hypothetical protein